MLKSNERSMMEFECRCKASRDKPVENTLLDQTLEFRAGDWRIALIQNLKV